MPKYVSGGAREFTDFTPSCALNQMLQEKYNAKNSHEYRYYLQKNAETVMKDLANCNAKAECEFCPVCKSAIYKK